MNHYGIYIMMLGVCSALIAMYYNFSEIRIQILEYKLRGKKLSIGAYFYTGTPDDKDPRATKARNLVKNRLKDLEINVYDINPAHSNDVLDEHIWHDSLAFGPDDKPLNLIIMCIWNVRNTSKSSFRNTYLQFENYFFTPHGKEIHTDDSTWFYNRDQLPEEEASEINALYSATLLQVLQSLNKALKIPATQSDFVYKRNRVRCKEVSV